MYIYRTTYISRDKNRSVILKKKLPRTIYSTIVFLFSFTDSDKKVNRRVLGNERRNYVTRFVYTGNSIIYL